MVNKSNRDKLKKLSHSIGQNWYHIVIIPKKRFPVFQWKKTREIATFSMEQICKNHNIEIYAKEIMKDHIHLFIDCPTNLSVRKLIQLIKEGSSYLIRKNYPSLKKYKHLWSRGTMQTQCWNNIRRYCEKLY